jgi:hypothetical protein
MLYLSFHYYLTFSVMEPEKQRPSTGIYIYTAARNMEHQTIQSVVIAGSNAKEDDGVLIRVSHEQ